MTNQGSTFKPFSILTLWFHQISCSFIVQKIDFEEHFKVNTRENFILFPGCGTAGKYSNLQFPFEKELKHGK